MQRASKAVWLFLVGYVERLGAIGITIDSLNHRQRLDRTKITTHRGTYHQARKAGWLKPILARF
jgi:hypothetical protein